MTLPLGITPGDLERAKFREGSTAGTVALATVNSDGSRIAGASIFTLPFDYVVVAYPDAVTETYTSKVGGSGGSVQQVATVVYTDSTKASLDHVTRT